MYKAVLFDLDGTLIDTNKLIMESFKHTFKEELNISIDDKEALSFFGEPLATSLGKYGGNDVDKLLEVYRSFNEKMHDTMTTAIDGVHETLRELRLLGIKVAVVTSKRRSMAERGLRLFDIYDYMDAVITPEDTERHKPNGEPALKACEILGVHPEEALFVGDSHFDIQCGHNAGMKSCFVGYSAIAVEDILDYKPDYTIDSLFDIINIVKEEKGLETPRRILDEYVS